LGFYLGNCWGESNPDIDERAVSWQTWETSLGVKGTVQGDQDWGKIEVTDELIYYGSIVDSETTFVKTFIVYRDKYGTGSGVVDISIRGSDIIFSQHDGSPSWEAYTAPISRAWRYVQLKMVYVSE
jgi:hypothetical protein